LANIKQAKKRVRQNVKRRACNKWQVTRMNTFVKRVVKAIESKNKELAQTEYKLATSILDRAASKGLIHKNKATRHKSRLAQQIKAMAVAA
jgi:small subunit ribosomal protein S20